MPVQEEVQMCNYDNFKSKYGDCDSYQPGKNNNCFYNDNNVLSNGDVDSNCKSLYACNMDVNSCKTEQMPVQDEVQMQVQEEVQYVGELPEIFPQKGKPNTYCTEEKFRSGKENYLIHNKDGKLYSHKKINGFNIPPKTDGCESYKYGNANAVHCNDPFVDSEWGFYDPKCLSKDACNMKLCNKGDSQARYEALPDITKNIITYGPEKGKHKY